MANDELDCESMAIPHDPVLSAYGFTEFESIGHSQVGRPILRAVPFVLLRISRDFDGIRGRTWSWKDHGRLIPSVG